MSTPHLGRNLRFPAMVIAMGHAMLWARKVALRGFARIVSSGLCLVAKYGRYFRSAGLSSRISDFLGNIGILLYFDPPDRML